MEKICGKCALFSDVVDHQKDALVARQAIRNTPVSSELRTHLEYCVDEYASAHPQPTGYRDCEMRREGYGASVADADSPCLYPDEDHKSPVGRFFLEL